MQKFNKGDLVQVAKDLGFGMSHFKSDCKAVVQYSYASEYGGSVGSNGHSYGLAFENGNTSAWYYESQLTLIEKDKQHLVAEWEAKREERDKKESDLDYIFSRTAEEIPKMTSISVVALAKTMGWENLWGSRGEGYAFYTNCRAVLSLALPYIVAKDKEGWIKKAEEIKADVATRQSLRNRETNTPTPTLYGEEARKFKEMADANEGKKLSEEETNKILNKGKDVKGLKGD